MEPFTKIPAFAILNDAIPKMAVKTYFSYISLKLKSLRKIFELKFEIVKYFLKFYIRFKVEDFLKNP